MANITNIPDNYSVRKRNGLIWNGKSRYDAMSMKLSNYDLLN